MDLGVMHSFVALGFGHITETGAMDHILFLLVLAAIYRWREWRQALTVVTAFTVGHSATLALAVLKPGLLPDAGIVEFLIPLTIVATGIENLVTRGVVERRVHIGRRAVLAGAFGLVHGAGFAGYLTQIFPGSIVAPLLGFNIGIELGQAVVLATSFVLLAALDMGLRGIAARCPWPAARSGFRWRVASVSLLVALIGGVWAVERVPW
jgi:HupE/UreJ protein